MEKNLKKPSFYRVLVPALSGILAMSAILSGCGSASQSSQPASGSDSTSSSGGKTGSVSKLTLWDIQTQDSQKLIVDETDKFNKAHSDIQVTPQWFQNDPYKDKIRISLGAGNPPDIFYNWGGGPLADYVKAGDVVDLTSYLNADSAYKNKFIDSVWGPATVDGKIYGVPTEGSAGELLYYNKALFKKYNLDPPTTWDNLLKAVKVLKDNGIAPIALEGKSQWPEMIWVQYLTARLGGTQVFDKIAKGEPGSWSDPAILKALQYCQQLVDMGAFQTGYTSLDADKNESEPLIVTGKAGMIAQGSWVYSNFQTNYPDFVKSGDLGYTAFPTIDPQYGDIAVGAPSSYYSISSKSKNPEAAMTYLKEVSLNDDEVTAYINKLGAIPPVKNIDDQLKASPTADFQIWLHGIIAKAPTVQLYWDQYLSATLAKQLLDNISKVFIKQETPQQLVDNMNKNMAAAPK
ncbi:extracellular solute-binding protein [Paenibacillus humicola]|uniref:extracellular solute-binding protein n=1 Tax=Paenibacillus humicola TaxID=3110540 RepID=UPI00237B0DD0|nr:extracellular solute-binding protein [Paenibacillus humicola]